MHPVLLEIPLPRLRFPVGPSLVALAVVALVVAALGRRSRTSDLVSLGLFGAAGASFGAFRLWGTWVELSPMPLYGFGVMLCVALVAGWMLALRLGDRDGISRETITNTGFAAAISGLLGSRVLYVLTNLRDFHSLGEVLAFRSGGLVFYGAVIGGFAGGIVSLRGRAPWLSVADIGAASLALGSAIGRLGCYLAGCDYGLPLGSGAPRWLSRIGTFPRWPDEIAGPGAGSPAWVDHVLYRGLPVNSIASLPVHPTQLYESLGSAVVFASLVWLRAHRRFRGQLLLTFIAGYGTLRFLLEFVRDDPERGSLGPLSTSQWIAALSLLAAVIAWRGLAQAQVRAPTAPPKGRTATPS